MFPKFSQHPKSTKQQQSEPSSHKPTNHFPKIFGPAECAKRLNKNTTIALQLGITANEWTVFLTILDTVQNWVQTCTFNHPLRAVCLQKRFKTTFWLQEPMLKPPLNFKPTFSRSGPKRSLRRPLRGVGAEL